MNTPPKESLLALDECDECHEKGWMTAECLFPVRIARENDIPFSIVAVLPHSVCQSRGIRNL
jgi:hypothetical protein